MAAILAFEIKQSPIAALVCSCDVLRSQEVGGSGTVQLADLAAYLNRLSAIAALEWVDFSLVNPQD